VVGGFVYRTGVGALPFLLPLLLQLGFHLTPFESGLITLSSAVGAMTMKMVVPFILRRAGFRNVLTANAVISAAFVAACAAFTPATLIPVIIVVLLIGGFFRSLQFTSLATIAYAELDPRSISRATPLVSVSQQLSVSTGVALGALAVDLTLHLKQQTTVTAADFAPAFILIGLISASAAVMFARLPEHAGAELANRTPAPTEESDQRLG
jgi:MFS family permease